MDMPDAWADHLDCDLLTIPVAHIERRLPIALAACAGIRGDHFDALCAARGGRTTYHIQAEAVLTELRGLHASHAVGSLPADTTQGVRDR